MLKLNFKENLKQLRIEKGLSQDELAKLLNTSLKTISHWENGINEPQLNKLRIFCDNFKVPISYFTGDNIKTENDYKGSRKRLPFLFIAFE